MGKFSVTATNLNTKLKKAKQKTQSFAYATGTKTVDDYFGLDHIAKPAALMRDAKAEKDAKGNKFVKVAYGMAILNGRILELRCEVTVLSMAKKMQKFFKAHKRFFNVQVMDEHGVLIEETNDVLPPDPDFDPTVAPAVQPTSATPQPPDGKRKAALKLRLTATEPGVHTFVLKDKAKGAQVLQVVKNAQSALDNDDLDTAETKIIGLENFLQGKTTGQPPQAKTPTPKNVEPLRKKIKTERARLDPKIRDFLKRAHPTLRKQAAKHLTAYKNGIDGPNPGSVEQALIDLEALIDAEIAALPPVSEAQKAKDRIAAAKGTVPATRHAKSGTITAKYPKGAAAANKAMDDFAAILGDQPVNQKMFKQALEDRKRADADIVKFREVTKKALALPAGAARDAAVAAARSNLREAYDKYKETYDFIKAVQGRKALQKALAVGPLSANSGQAFSDDAAAALIAAFVRDPDMAVAAVNIAKKAERPDAVALNLTKLMDQQDKGYEEDQPKPPSTTKRKFKDARQCAAYTIALLQMGGTLGQAYFDRMDDYFASGRLHEDDPLGEKGAKNERAREQIRTVAVGDALLDGTGQINVTSQKAKDAVGDLLFNCSVQSNAMATLNAEVLKTMALFEDATTGPQANTILSNVQDPPPASSEFLVRQAVRKKTPAPVEKRDVQKAVLAAMLKPLDQGPVGSCFSTAPARRMRHEKPLVAMQAFADIASKGKYKPADGPEVNVVTRIPQDEDPIMRCWEYTLATSTAQSAQSITANQLATTNAPRLEEIGRVTTGVLAKGGWFGLGSDKQARAQKKTRTKDLNQKIAGGVVLVYDPTRKIKKASDGSSTQGGYVLRRKDTQQEITTPEAYATYVADKVIESFKITPDSDAAKRVKKKITGKKFRQLMTGPDGFSPWNMRSGGYTVAATQTLFGATNTETTMTAEAKDTDTQADRTTAVLKNMLNQLAGGTEEMITVATTGIHGFNALPNDPSLAPLKQGGPAQLDQNVKTELLDKGTALSTTALALEKSIEMYDQIANDLLMVMDDAERKVLLPELKSRIPKKALKPEEIADLVKEAITAAAPGLSDPAREDKLKKYAHTTTQNVILTDAGAPEFKIADTNWGDASYHSFMVVAPDPISGDPALWKKMVPPGRLTKMDDKWANARWTAIQ